MVERLLQPRVRDLQRRDVLYGPGNPSPFRQGRWRLLDAMQPSAYGIYLLHYIFIVWLQYAVYELPLHAGAKFAIVFVRTLSISWILTIVLRKIPFVARMI
jgi:surface polysaccharide O-acyltransferase-like enzyme